MPEKELKTNNDHVSILMPVKNAALFLDECLNSIISQQEKNWELIAINDHSTDTSKVILESFVEKDERVRVYDNHRNGIIEALRLAYTYSTGQYITRMDADDVMHTNKIENLKSKVKHFGKGHVAVGGVEYFSKEPLGEGYSKYAKWLNALSEKGQNFQEIYKECVIPSPCWMMHRSDFNRIGAFDLDIYPEDYDLCFRMYINDLVVIPCSKILHKWRDHSNRSSRTMSEYADNSFLSLKLKYFFKKDWQEHKTLVVWGAGTKGKKVASILIDSQKEFKWICNNQNKIGRDIYGIKLEDITSLDHNKEYQFLVLVANSEEQLSIRNNDLFKINSTSSYFFC